LFLLCPFLGKQEGVCKPRVAFPNWYCSLDQSGWLWFPRPAQAVIREVYNFLFALGGWRAGFGGAALTVGGLIIACELLSPYPTSGGDGVRGAKAQLNCAEMI